MNDRLRISSEILARWAVCGATAYRAKHVSKALEYADALIVEEAKTRQPSGFPLDASICSHRVLERIEGCPGPVTWRCLDCGERKVSP